MKKIIIIIMIFFTFNLFSQDTLYLDSCIDNTIRNHPMQNDFIYNQKIQDLRIKNNRSNYYPTLDFEGKFSYQSDVFGLNIELPEIPGFEIDLPNPPLDQYNFALNLSQLLYDGGATKKMSFVEQKKLLAEQKKTDIELYKLKQQVENTYFSILILQKTEDRLRLTIKELEQQKRSAKSAVNNGILTPDNYDILQAEIYKLEQNLIEVEENKKAGLKILKELMCIDIPEEIIVSTPEDPVIISDSIQIDRPEFELFDLQSDMLNANIKLLQTARFPKLAAFAQVGYGNPGLTMITDEWSPYYIVGAKLTWTIWDKNKTKRNKEILNISNDLINTKKESLTKSINIQGEKELAEIKKINKLTEKDDKIIKLHESICNKASSKLDNGTITSIDYIKLLNEKNRAKIKKEIHKVQLIQAKRNYLRITGN